MRSLSTAAVAAFAFVASTAAALPVSPRDRPVPREPAPELAPTGFDLTIRGADAQAHDVDAAQWYGLSGTFAVHLKNLGTKTVTQESVTCTLAGASFTAVSGGPTLAAGAEGSFLVATRTDWMAIPLGPQAVHCTVGILQPKGAYDDNHANDVWSGTVTVVDQVAGPPDLVPQSAPLRDCATHAAPTPASDACIDLEYQNAGGRLTQPFTVQCAVQSTAPSPPPAVVRSAAGLTPMHAGRLGYATLDVGKLAQGAYRITCRLDTGNAIAEKNEANNGLGADASVGAVGSTTYDLAIVSADASVAHISQWYGQASFAVQLKNGGTGDILQPSVTCNVGGSTFTSLSAGPTAKPGTTWPFTVVAKTYPAAKGAQPVTCTASIVTPQGVHETNTANNAWSGTVQLTP